MTGGEGALGEIRKALAGITHRLDALAAAVGVATAAGTPPGALLDEPVRAELSHVAGLLRVGRTGTPEEATLLAIDRVLSHALADCAALLVPVPDASCAVLAAHGFRAPLDVPAATGIVGRCAALGEIVQGGPGLGGADPLLDAHDLGQAIAVPVTGESGEVAAVLLAGRRRSVAFGVEALQALVVTADRVGDALRRSWSETPRLRRATPEAPFAETAASAPPGAAAGPPESTQTPSRAVAPTGSPAALSELSQLLALVVARLAAARARGGGDAAGDVEAAEDAAWRAAEAVRRVLGLDPGAGERPLAPVDLSALVRETVMSAERRWTAEGWDALVALDLQAVPPVRGSAEELRHALDHVLQNAREASDPGAPIAVRLRWDGGPRVELTITDGGRGMDAQTAARAGEPFFTTKGPGRLGVGLAIARAAAARHRGQLAVDSATGRGTTVRLELPASGVPVRPVEQAARRPATSRVLVVEDEPTVREVLAQGLEQDGRSVRTAEDVPSALALLDEAPVDAVITDLALPGGSGLEVARQARRLHPRAAIILMTGWPGRIEADAAAGHGVDAILEKPVGLETLRSTLASLLGRSSARAT